MNIATVTLEKHPLSKWKSKSTGKDEDWLGYTHEQDAIIRARGVWLPFFGKRIVRHELDHKIYADFFHAEDHHDDPAWQKKTNVPAHKCGRATAGLMAHLSMKHLKTPMALVNRLIAEGRVEVFYETDSQIDWLAKKSVRT